nr:hypothetical protein BaRGS_020979 [Batillaria attramentaria]
MPHYHCVAIGYQNGSRKSDKLEKFPETVLPNGGLFASPALESTRLFVTGNSGIAPGRGRQSFRDMSCVFVGKEWSK